MTVLIVDWAGQADAKLKEAGYAHHQELQVDGFQQVLAIVQKLWDVGLNVMVKRVGHPVITVVGVDTKGFHTR